jgi:hypothetical protein
MSQALFRGHRVLWTSFDEAVDIKGARAHCCGDMEKALTFTCEQHTDPFECADQLLCFNGLFEEYGLIIHDGGASYVCIAHCPWCGARLPDSRRDQYFDLLETLGLETSQDDLPERFRHSGWWLESTSPSTTPPDGAERHE